jgi:hypothetical protein
MTQQAAARMCHASIQATIRDFGACEHHMQAVDALAQGFSDRDGSPTLTMLAALWGATGTDGFGSFGYQIMFEWASPSKDSALQIVTGKRRSEWLRIINY